MHEAFVKESKLFWEEVLEEKDIPEKYLNELVDFHYLMCQIPIVYDYVTGGQISKIMTSSDSIITAVDDFQDQFIHSVFKDELEEIAFDLGFVIPEEYLEDETIDRSKSFFIDAIKKLIKRQENNV